MRPTDEQLGKAFNMKQRQGDGWYLACIVGLFVIGGVAILGLLMQCGG